MPKIITELKQVPYLSQIVIGLDRADESQYREGTVVFLRACLKNIECYGMMARDSKPWMQNYKNWIWRPKELGKGRNVWYCMGYTLASNKAESVALHDCDITHLQSVSC